MTDYQKGMAITLIGVAVLIPDSILLRYVDSLHYLTIMFYRGLLASIALLTFFVFFSKTRITTRYQTLTHHHIYITAVIAMGNLSFVAAVYYTSIANTLIIIACSPVFASIISRIFLKERIPPLTLITIFFASIGIACIALAHLDESGVAFSLAGDLAALGTSISLATVLCLSRRVQGRGIPESMAFSGLIVAAIAAGFAPTLVIDSLPTMLALLTIGCVITPVGYNLLNYGPKFLPAPEVGLILLLETICAPLLAWAIFAEYPGAFTLIGGTIILAAISISTGIRLWQQQ